MEAAGRGREFRWPPPAIPPHQGRGQGGRTSQRGDPRGRGPGIRITSKSVQRGAGWEAPGLVTSNATMGCFCVVSKLGEPFLSWREGKLFPAASGADRKVRFQRGDITVIVLGVSGVIWVWLGSERRGA